MKKAVKIILWSLAGLFFAFCLFVLVSFFIHKGKLKKEYEYLKDAGYLNQVNAGEYALNIYQYGNPSGAHTLIGLSGLGIHDYGVEMKYAMEGLSGENRIVFIDRAGYGYSDDTKIRQSVEQVVNDYRTALCNAGIEPPYVLMPHSLGGMYATYWESKYPEEVEGVIFIDASELGMDIWDEKDFSVSFVDKFLIVPAIRLGLHRYVLRRFYDKLPSALFSADDQKMSDSLNLHWFQGYANLSEIAEMNNNTNQAYTSIVKNDIPKIYICANTGYSTISEVRAHTEWVKERQKESKLPSYAWPTEDEKILAFIAGCEKWREENILPYLEKLGNTELVLLPGHHMIFLERPEELKEIIRGFLEKLEQQEGEQGGK